MLKSCLPGGHWVRALLLWLGLALWTQPVRADAKDEARILFEAGVTASRADRWFEASEYFQRSLSLSEKPSTWFNLAVAEVKLGHGPEALRALDAFEQMATREDHAEMLDRAVTLRVQAQALVEQQETSAGEPMTSAPSVDTPAPPAGAPAFGTAAEAARLPEYEEEINRRGPRILLGVGVAVLAGSLATLGWWVNRVNAHDRCTSDPARCTNETQLTRQERAAGGTSLALGLVSAALITGGAIWLARENRRARRLHTSLHMDRQTVAGSMALTF